MSKINFKAAVIFVFIIAAIFLIATVKDGNKPTVGDPISPITETIINIEAEAETDDLSAKPPQESAVDFDEEDIIPIEEPYPGDTTPAEISTTATTCLECTEETIAEGITIIKNPNIAKVTLLNQIDGYSLTLPQEMQITDTTTANIRLVLEDQHRKLEIYKQPLMGINPSPQIYISYSNRFLSNRDDHQTELLKQVKIGGYQGEVRQWSRKKLARLANDKNYYTSIDLIANKAVYTFFIKSDLPFVDANEYLDLIKDFKVFEPSAKATDFKIKQTANAFWNEETQAFYKKYFLAGGDLVWGIFEPTAPYSFEALNKLEARLDYDFEFLLVYKSVQKTYPTGYVKNTLQEAYDQGKIVELTLQTVAQEQGEGNMVYDILDGAYDEFLTSFAKETAEFGHPVLFRFGNEMNGDWCVYSAYHTAKDTNIFIELYKYIHSVFESEQADNVIWVWNPNEKSYPDYKWNNELMYYPGDEYVDLVGITGYNNGTYYQAVGETWRSFTEIYDPLYQRMTAISEKPLIITEFSSSSVGGNKEEWTRNMFANLYKYPRIKLAIWWNGCDWDQDGNTARPYFIDESEELLQIFNENLKK